VINFSLLHIIDYSFVSLFQSSPDYPIKISEKLELIGNEFLFTH